jgi:8-oxo-dGTP pyrophosphatase MutT (NUDIX family)
MEKKSICNSNMCSCSPKMLELANMLDKTLAKGKWGDEPPKILAKQPHTSYGLMVFHWDVTNNRPLYFLGQDRDSIPYVVFLRGRYKIGYIERYFSLMTLDERKRLKTHTFDELWKDMCVKLHGKLFKTEREDAYRHWLRVTDESNGMSLLDMWLNATKSIQPEASWGFPKGRLFKKEGHLDGAYREFEEETGLLATPADFYVNNVRPSMLSFDTEPYTETFYGSDDILYRSVYFLTLMVRPFHPRTMIRDDLIRKEMISDEMSDYGWFTFDEAIKKLDSRKQKLLTDAHSWVLAHTNHRGLVSCRVLPTPKRRKYNNYLCDQPQRNFRYANEDSEGVEWTRGGNWR